jgi:hypothetical protein
LRTPAFFALVDVVDKPRLLYFSARKQHCFTTLDTIGRIVQRSRLINAKLIHAICPSAHLSKLYLYGMQSEYVTSLYLEENLKFLCCPFWMSKSKRQVVTIGPGDLAATKYRTRNRTGKNP